MTTDRVLFRPDGQHLLLECASGSERFLRPVVLRPKSFEDVASFRERTCHGWKMNI